MKNFSEMDISTVQLFNNMTDDDLKRDPDYTVPHGS